MDAEHEIDPTIDPKVLIEQEGENAGRIAAVETSTPTLMFDSITAPEAVEGLPVIGADAENELRNKHESPFRSVISGVGLTPEEKNEHIKSVADKAGTEAMAAAVKERAIALLPEGASDAQKEEYGELAATKFKEMLESKLAERKEAANAEVQAMIDKLKDSDSVPGDVLFGGLTEIGNKAVEAARKSRLINPLEVVEKLRQEYRQSLANGVPEAEAIESMAIKAGIEAKAAEVKKRAKDLTTKAADEALREEYGELAATKFKEGLESELAEKKNAAESEAQEMIDALRALGAGELPPELKLPETQELESEAAKKFKTLGIHVETPQGHSGFSHLEGTEIAP